MSRMTHPAQASGLHNPQCPACQPDLAPLILHLPSLFPLKAALYAAPYKSDFLKALSKGQNVTEEECLEKIRLFLVNYTATIDAIYDMYTKMNAELDYTV